MAEDTGVTQADVDVDVTPEDIDAFAMSDFVDTPTYRRIQASVAARHERDENQEFDEQYYQELTEAVLSLLRGTLAFYERGLPATAT